MQDLDRCRTSCISRLSESISNIYILYILSSSFHIGSNLFYTSDYANAYLFPPHVVIFRVMDLYFKNEDAFQAVMTQIRKTKIGPRYLPVTFFKTLNKDEQDPDCPQPFARGICLTARIKTISMFTLDFWQ